jgi:hypothetical protein
MISNPPKSNQDGILFALKTKEKDWKYLIILHL